MKNKKLAIVFAVLMITGLVIAQVLTNKEINLSKQRKQALENAGYGNVEYFDNEVNGMHERCLNLTHNLCSQYMAQSQLDGWLQEWYEKRADDLLYESPTRTQVDEGVIGFVK